MPQPLITALRTGKWCFAGPASGQNCDTTAPRAAISDWSTRFDAG